MSAKTKVKDAYGTLVVPYDFSPCSEAALDTAVDLARRLRAALHLVHVVQMPLAYGAGILGTPAAAPAIDAVEMRHRALTDLRHVADTVAGAPQTHVLEGIGIADAIGEKAEELGADLIVMGTHGRTGLAHVFLGSVTERTLRRAPCPVLAVRACRRPRRAAAKRTMRPPGSTKRQAGARRSAP
jgi:nucleotide-binding universal stress UspA family protein